MERNISKNNKIIQKYIANKWNSSSWSTIRNNDDEEYLTTVHGFEKSVADYRGLLEDDVVPNDLCFHIISLYNIRTYLKRNVSGSTL